MYLFAHEKNVLGYIFRLQTTMSQNGDDGALIDNINRQHALKKESFYPLYNNYINLLPALQEDLKKEWQLLVLSGDIDALQNSISQFSLTKDRASELGLNALHYAALSHNKDMLMKALDLGIDFHSTSKDKLNVLHFAILSKNLDQINSVLTLEKNYGTTLALTAKDGKTALMIAALTNSEIFKRVLKIYQERKLDIKACDNQGYNIYNYAIKGDNKQVIDLVYQLGIKPGTGLQDDFTWGDRKKPLVHYKPTQTKFV